jgi:hypothetical protein
MQTSMPTPPLSSVPAGWADGRGKFRKMRVKPMKGYGTYRGQGRVTVDPDRGITIEGNRAKPTGTRIAIAIGLFLASAIVTYFLFGMTILLGFIPLYLLVEYVFLDDGGSVLPFSSIADWAHDPKKKLISFRVANWPRGRDTVTFMTPAHAQIAAAFARTLSASPGAASALIPPPPAP